GAADRRAGPPAGLPARAGEAPRPDRPARLGRAGVIVATVVRQPGSGRPGSWTCLSWHELRSLRGISFLNLTTKCPIRAPQFQGDSLAAVPAAEAQPP